MQEIQTTKRKRGIHTHFRSFSEARAFVHTLRLPNSVEYHRWARGNDGLEDIPVNPNLAYGDCGWQGWADWLGCSYRSSKKPFVPYEDARAFVHPLRFPTKEAFDRWIASSERAAQIPACPHLTYKNSGWRDWQDFLGYGGRKRGHGQNQFLPFQEARAWAHAQRFTTSIEWHRVRAQGLLPHNIPTAPDLAYQKSGWVNWQDWLGQPSREKRWRSFQEAREFARSLGFTNAPTYRKWAMTLERPPDVPAAPHCVYRNKGWTDWYDWLGHPRNQARQYLSFDEARAFMRQLSLVGSSGWAEWCRDGFRPNNIPSNPASFYRDQGWQNWPDFLGMVGQSRKRRPKQDCWRPFQEARQFVHSLGLWSIQAWGEWCATSARPHDIPEHPAYAYKNEGWAGWRDFLGKIPSEGNAAGSVLPSRKWRTFEDARDYVRALGFTSIEHWRQWADSSEKPYDIPKTPSYAYRDFGWAGMSDWLGLELQVGRPRGPHSRPIASNSR